MAEPRAHQQTRRTRASSPPGRESVVVHGSDVRVDRANFDLPVAEARGRFGGIDVPAILGGGLAGLGTAVLLAVIASALGQEVGQPDGETLAIGGLITALVVLVLSALAGGWVAGRSARFDGARNGLLAGLLLAHLLALLGAAGAYSAGDGGLAISLDSDGLRPAALIAAVTGLVVSLLAGAFGGRLGSRWHREVDDVIVGTRAGAVATPGSDVR